MRTTFCIVVLAAFGCNSAPPPRPDTGSREVAGAFFTAIAKQEWAGAFEKLHPDSRKNLTLAAFTERAKAYRKNLGFDFATVHVGVCEEQDDKANAHLVLSAAEGGRKHRFREAVVVRKGPDGWGVALPTNFGAKK